MNFCISGGYSVYRAGLCDSCSDVDIYVNNCNFNEHLFLKLDNGIRIISKYGKTDGDVDDDEDEDYDEIRCPIKKRYGFGMANSAYKIDFVLVDYDFLFRDNFTFSEYVTSGFDIDVYCVSIIKTVDYEGYRLVFNSNFKVFIKDEVDDDVWKDCCKCLDDAGITKLSLRRFKKYESRLKKCYRIFYSCCAPPFNFDHFVKFHQSLLECLEW